MRCYYAFFLDDVAEAESASDTIMKAAAAAALVAVGTNFGRGCTQPVSLSCHRKAIMPFCIFGTLAEKLHKDFPSKKGAREKPEVVF